MKGLVSSSCDRFTIPHDSFFSIIAISTPSEQGITPSKFYQIEAQMETDNESGISELLLTRVSANAKRLMNIGGAKV